MVPSHVDEDSLTDPDPWQTAQKLAKAKALAVREHHPDCLVIGGDTVVAVPELPGAWTQLAKPADREDAMRMLGVLSGRSHTVITGVCLLFPTGMSAFTDSSKVYFRRLSRDEMSAYVETGEPMDKAGSYGLQGMAKGFIDRVEGSVTNVIGLPMERLEEALKGAVSRK